LNHHYRIIWSQVSNTWVAVSELSKGHCKSSSARKHVVSALALLGLSALSMASSALDLPAGAQVTAGSAKIQTPAKGALLVNQSTQRAVINWSNFSIAQGNRVTFAQPNASAATLNIVTGNSASTIAGTLTGNGTVYLINQNGIAITPTGLVDTRTGFIASTLRMDENAFMGGKYLFSGKGGSVLNRGQIMTGPGGTVGLLGSTVANEGLISAPLGKVALGAGEAATLDLSGDGFLQVMLPTSALAADGQALVSNSGVIQADGGMVMLKAATVRQALREAVNMPGEISARSVSGKNGAIVLEAGLGGTVRVAGSLIADGDTVGGRIDVTGANVLLEGASLSATGTERGGLVRVGGAFQGGREQPADSANAALFAGRFGGTPALANATTTRIDAASNINVSATGVAGTGGTAIVWSDSTTVMQGAISARGALAGGAVEVSAKSTVQSVALKRIDLGKGGNLLIDPQDIVIDSSGTDTAADYNYATPGTITHLLDTDVTALLSAGTTVNLQASQDISWLGNAYVTRTSTTPGGNLNLSAGRSVTLSGIFNTADGNWNIVANDTAAHGVVDAERGAGAALIDVRNANFINSNGNLSLTLADGAGNTNREVDRITLGKFNGNGLTAAISSTAMPAYGTTQILLTDDINVSGTISLTGNLQVSSMSSMLSLSGQSVTWTDEKAGGTIRGEGAIKFIENGLTTHLGKLSDMDAVRLELDSQPGLTRVYGDSDPGMTDLTVPLLRVAAHSSSTSAADPLGDILGAGSLALSGPGVLASAGNNNLSLSATSSAALASGLNGSYFVDLSATSIPLTITQRRLTSTISNGAYTYGSPDAVASLNGLVNGDMLTPLATLNGAANVTMDNNGLGFGFDPKVHAGASSFSLTGLSGVKASNYLWDLSGSTVSGTLNIAPKALNYVATDGWHVYGSAGTMPTATLSGIIAGDDVAPVVSLIAAGQAVSLTTRMPASTYAADVLNFTGAAAGNYTIATTGNTSGRYVVNPKWVTVSFDPAGISSTYGTLDQTILSQGVTLTGVLAGDTVTPNVDGVVSNSLNYRSPVGNYATVVTGLGGASGSNYALTNNDGSGMLTINKKLISYFGGDISQVYGQATLPSPWFLGVLSADLLGVTASQVISYPSSYAPSGSGNLPVGSYQVDLGAITGTSAGNYSLDRSASTPQRVTVTPKPVGVAYMNSLFSTYGTQADMSLANPSLSGIQPGDIVAGQTYAYDQLRGGNVDAKTPVGTYNVALNALSGVDSANYMVANNRQSVSSLTINPKNVTVQFTNPSSTYVYGDTVDFGGTIDGLVAGDIVSPVLKNINTDGSPATDTYLNVGSYNRIATALDGPNAWNYRVINSRANFNITPRPLAYSIAPITKTYGEPMQDWYEWVSFSNLVGQDKVRAKIGYQYGYLPGTSGYFPGDTVMTDRSPAGDYTSVVTGLIGSAASNYMLPPLGFNRQINKGLLTILPKPVISRIDNVNSVYGIAAVLGLGRLDGVLAGDSVNAGPTTLAEGTQPKHLTNAGIYYLRTEGIWGAQSGNYEVIRSEGQLTIQPRVLTRSFSFTWNNRSIYSGGTYGDYYRPTGVMSDSEAVTYGINGVMQLQGMLAGDDVKESVAAPYHMPFSKSGAYLPGTYTWNRSGVLTGVNASNYVISPDIVVPYTFTIAPKKISGGVAVTSGVNELFTAVYGTPMGLKALGDAGVVTTPFGKDDAVFRPYIKDANNNRAPFIWERQAAGNYTLVTSFFGADVANYVLPENAYERSFEITRKPISLSIAGNGLVNYGSNVLPWVYSGLLPGDTVQAVSFICSQFKCGTAADARNYLPFRTPVGYYYATLTDLVGQSAANYQWTNAVDPGNRNYSFAIQPLQLRWSQDAGNLSITYGDKLPAINKYSLSGILPGDDVIIGEPIATPISVAVGGSGVRRGTDTIPDAGTYTYTGVAAAGSNYLLPVDGKLTVAPKPLAYAVTDVSGQYGNYKACNTNTCDPWLPGIDLGQIIVPGALVGDRLSGTIGLLDLKGEEVSLNDQTPVGNYFQVLTGLTGASAPNYVVASSGNVPGVLNIKPMWLSYATSSAVFVGSSGFGLVGTPGVATLRGPNGTPINGDDVKGNVAMVAANGRFVSDAAVEFQNLSSSRFTFPVVGLAGKDAGNYRILPNDHLSEASYGKNDIGTLDVYADTTLNRSTGAYKPPGAATANERLIPALPAYAPNPITTAINTVPALSGSQQATATTTTGTQTSVGEAELSANATASALALAQYGITDVKLVASANAGVEVKMDFGPGYASAQALTQALVSAKLNPTGLTVLANAGASAQAGVGYGTSTDAGKVALATTVTASAGASGTAKAGYNDGKVAGTTSGSVGVGVSVSGTAGLSGDAGSLQSTASVTSPGSLGGSGGGSVGYSDGRLRVSLEFGADIGIGGFKLKLDGDIEPGAVADFVKGDLKDAASAVGGAVKCVFTSCSSAPPPAPPSESDKYYSRIRLIDSLTPAAKYAYLVSNDEWDRGVTNGGFQGEIAKVNEYKAFRQEFGLMVGYANHLKAVRENMQRNFLDLLSSDPSQAIALSHAGFLDPSVDQSKSKLLMNYGGLGFDSNYAYYASQVKAQAVRWNVGIVMEDGRMTFRDAKK